MPNNLYSESIAVIEEFAKRAGAILSQERWKNIQLLINQINEIDPDRYNMRINKIDSQNGNVSIAIIDLKQKDNKGNPQQTFSMHASPSAYMYDKKKSIGFSEYGDEGNLKGGTPADPRSSDIDFIISKLPLSLPKDVYDRYAEKYLSDDNAPAPETPKA